MENKGYIINYKNDNGSYCVYHSETREITTENDISYKKYPRRFRLLKPYKATYEGLKEYAKDFEIFSEELKNRQKCFIDYKYYFNDNTAVISTFQNFCKATGYENHDKISLEELKWINKCNNGGLMFCKPGEYECFGYDFSMFYLRILGEKISTNCFQFPCKQGYETHIDALPDVLPFGYYKCRITSEHPDVKKVFMFSKNNVYTNYSIQFARDLADDFGFDISIIDDKINCYVYNTVDIIKSQKIFNPMFYKMSCMKKDFPKNRLVKHIASSISGHLIKYNLTSINKKDVSADMWDEMCYYADEMPNECTKAIVEDVMFDDYPDNDHFKVLDLITPMEYPVGRYKAFLMSFARNKCARAALVDIESVVRIQTDGIVFTKPQTFMNFLFIGEDKKYTGRMTWEHVNKCIKP